MLLKNKGFEEDRMTKIGWRAFVNSTTLESNKSLNDMVRRRLRAPPRLAQHIEGLGTLFSNHLPAYRNLITSYNAKKS
jgi:hypothetical protein